MNECKVLIVDDEVLTRQGIKYYLSGEQEGFRIVGEASNGEEALALIETTRPHIVLTDIVMPVMDGEELTRAIKAKYPDIEVIVLSSFGEFDYVRSTFQSGVADYILKPKLEAKELHRVLRAAAAKIPSLRSTQVSVEGRLSVEQILEKFAAGYDADYDMELILKEFPYDTFCLLGIELRRFPVTATSGATPTVLWPPLIRIIEDELAKNLPQAAYCYFAVDQNRSAFLLNVSAHSLPELKRVVEIVASSATVTTTDVVLALSEPFANFADTGKVCKEELLKLLQCRFYFPHKHLMVRSEMPQPAPQAVKFDLNRFTEQLRWSQFTTAFDGLKAHVVSLTDNYWMDVFEYKSFLSNSIFNITVLLGNMGYHIQELEQAKYVFFNRIDKAQSAQEAADRLEDFIEKAMECIHSSPNRTSSTNMKMILEYIDQHYAEPLNLKELARQFHFNPTYLSSYFTANNKEGFAEYLNKIRIAKASELLRMDATPISEISGKVGYSDHSYFCKVFKKMMGLSPSGYRRQYMK